MEPPEHEFRSIKSNIKSLEYTKDDNKLMNKTNKSKTRRGYGNKNRNKNNKEKNKQLSIVGTNSAGLNSKKESFFSIINIIKPSIITVQETKHSKFRTLKIPGYQTFERIRNGKSGGGLLTSIINDLNPVLIFSANDNIELLTVEVKVGNDKIRIINGYGPQEHDDTNSILIFWQEFEAEVIRAKDYNRNIIVQMDANAKLGSEVIYGDPHKMSNNGKLLNDIIERQDLVVLNALEICKGTITRERNFENKSEKSVIDYILVSRDLVQFVTEIKIDEEKEHVLARYVKSKYGTKVIVSDHNILSCKFSIIFNKKPRKIRNEFFKFKCEEGRKQFLDETSNYSRFKECFDKNENFTTCSNKFYKALKRTFHKCFKKVRIVNGNKTKLGNAVVQDKLKLKSKLKSFLKNTQCEVTKERVKNKILEIDEAIANELASNNAKKVREYVRGIETLDGNFSQIGLWKLKQNLCQLQSDPPMAKYDNNGNLITSSEALKSLYLDTYKDRLKHIEMKGEYMDLFFLKTEQITKFASKTVPALDYETIRNCIKKYEK